MKGFVKLAQRLRYEWTDLNRLVDAFCHSSWSNEQIPKSESNERLEFLGDSVFDLVCAEFLMAKMPAAREGKLSQARAQMACESHLADVARKLKLGDLLLAGKGSEHIRTNPSVLADTMEAIIGAAFKDGGMQAARTVALTSGMLKWG